MPIKFENCWIPHIERNGPYLRFTMEFDVESMEDKNKMIELVQNYYSFNANVEISDVREVGEKYKPMEDGE